MNWVLFALLLIAGALVVKQREHAAVLRDRIRVLSLRLADMDEELDNTAEALGWHESVEDRLREHLRRVFGPDAVQHMDEAVWSVDLGFGLTDEERAWGAGEL